MDRKEYQRQYRLKNKEKNKEYQKTYRQKTKKEYNKWKSEWRKNNRGSDGLANKSSYRQKQKTRMKVLLHYGGKCSCCDESNLEFLAIDHKNGGRY